MQHSSTLASMAGGLLGVIAGTDWLQGYRSQLQDEQYITELVQRLERGENNQSANTELTKPSVRPGILVDRFLAQLPDRATEGRLELPDGRKATVKEVSPVDTKSRNLTGSQWKLRTDDGQFLYIKKLGRPPQTPAEQMGTSQSISKPSGTKKAVRFSSKAKAVKLIVRDLESSRAFYHEVLGLKADVNLGRWSISGESSLWFPASI
jgi:hypothetical protein